MAEIHVIEVVHIDQRSGQVSRIRWGVADTNANVWLTGPAVADVIEVVDKVMAGTGVWTTIPAGGGVETIIFWDAEDFPGRTIKDMEQF